MRKQTHSSNSRGFTLIELIVVIGIIGVLFAILLPAIYAVRSNSKRAQCSNHLRQIGMALLEHHTRAELFPAGYEPQSEDKTEPECNIGWGWGAFLLSDLDQIELQNELNPGARLDPMNYKRIALELDIWKCPADRVEGRTCVYRVSAGASDVDDDGNPIQFVRRICKSFGAKASYVGNYGSTPIRNDGQPGNGVFFRRAAQSLVTIVDGAGKTLLIGERHSKVGRTTWVGVHYDERSTTQYWDAMAVANSPAEALVLASTALPPNTPKGGAGGFSSAHGGGINVFFADGHSDYISDDVDIAVWHQMGSRRDTLNP